MDGEHKNIVNVRLYIEGMTCLNCEARIQKMLETASGVVSAGVSYAEGRADISYDRDKTSLEDIEGRIAALGYSVTGKRGGKAFIISLVKTLVILILFAALQYFGVLNYLVPSQLADTGMGYGMLFVIGLITSVHCIAMCGGINLSQSLPAKAGVRGKKAFLPSLMYNLGRVISYTAVGFILGFAGMILGGGSGTGVSYLLQGILKIIAGVLMVVMGINMLGIFPGLRRLALRPPKALSKKLNRAGKSSKTPLVVGLLNGLMPCGPLQSMQIVALASGNPITGALSMLVFSLGTVPLMLGLGSLVSLLGSRFTGKVMTAGAVLVTVLGLSMLSQGGSLSGLFQPAMMFVCVLLLAAVGVISCIPFRRACKKRAAVAAAAVCAAAALVLCSIRAPAFLRVGEGSSAVITDGVQTVCSTLSPGQYPDIRVRAGMPVKWVIEAAEDDINGCNYRILIDEYGLEYTFHAGENVIEFTPERSGTFTYSCWMGMIHGSITVTE